VLFNLDVREQDASVPLFNPNDADSYNSSTSLTIYDSRGLDHVLTTYYVKSPYEDNTWDLYAYVPDEDGEQVNVLSTGVVTDDTAATAAAQAGVVALNAVQNTNIRADIVASAYSPADAGALTIALQVARASLIDARDAATTTADFEENQAAIDSLDEINNTLGIDFVGGATAANAAEAQSILDQLSSSDGSVALASAASATSTAISASVTQGLTVPYFQLNYGTDGTLTSASPFPLTIDAWDPGGANQSSTEGSTAINSDFTIDIGASTQFGSDFSVTAISQDGFATGQLSGLEIDGEGKIFARYTNGQAEVLGGVSLASFTNEQGLSPQGNTGWAESSESGEPAVGQPQSGTLGSIQSGALEESNVDLSEELVRLIIAQRNFQANAKTIETADTVQQAIINLR
jgi:flagellar hook protein FlgE